MTTRNLLLTTLLVGTSLVALACSDDATPLERGRVGGAAGAIAGNGGGDLGGSGGTGGNIGGASGSAGAGGLGGSAGASGLGGSAGQGGFAGNSIQELHPVEGVAKDITLEIYSDGWGRLIETKTLASEGPIVIDVVEEQPYSNPAQYFIYAKAAGFFTELYYATKGESITVDLDAVPQEANSMAGVVFATQAFFKACYHAGASLELSGPNGLKGVLKTDAQGRYDIQAPAGDYVASLQYQNEPFSFELRNTAGTDYKDLSFQEPMQAAAPNVYIYPTVTTDINVTLGFPQGGHVIESDPPYNTGWSVRVHPDGMIDGGYSYLFYEASLPSKVQVSEGWLLSGNDFEGELRNLLTRIGFVGREIDDFVAYWVPILKGSPWYAVYPQDAAGLVSLEISPRPDQVLRTLLLIRPLRNPLPLTPPAPAPFVRSGYSVAEWGVLVGI